MQAVGVASMIHMFTRFIVAVIFVKFNKVTKEALLPFNDPESTKDLKDMFVLGFNSFLLRVMAWWAFDVFTQLAASLETQYLGGQTILRNIGLYTYMIPVGLSSAANILVGRYIGKDKVSLAHRISNMCMFVTFIWSMLQVAILVLFKDSVIHFYSKES